MELNLKAGIECVEKKNSNVSLCYWEQYPIKLISSLYGFCEPLLAEIIAVEVKWFGLLLNQCSAKKTDILKDRDLLYFIDNF